jgi:hypothetical protein
MHGHEAEALQPATLALFMQHFLQSCLGGLRKGHIGQLCAGVVGSEQTCQLTTRLHHRSRRGLAADLLSTRGLNDLPELGSQASVPLARRLRRYLQGNTVEPVVVAGSMCIEHRLEMIGARRHGPRLPRS